MRPRSNIQWTVLHNAIPFGHRTNVCSLHLRPAAAVENSQAGNGTSVPIGRFDKLRKGQVPEASRCQLFDDGVSEDGRFFDELQRDRTGGRLLRSREGLQQRLESRPHDPVEFGLRNSSNGTAECSLVHGAIGSPQASLVIMLALFEGHRSIELEKIRNESVEMIRNLGVRFDPSDSRGGEIRLPSAATAKITTDPSGFVVDDPVA